MEVSKRDFLRFSVGAASGTAGGYTGVVLAVTNRPIWSDTPLLGMLFVVSAASISAALMISPCAEIQMDYARAARLAPHGCMGGRVGIYRFDRRHDIAGAGLSRLAKRLGSPALFWRHRSRNANSFVSVLSQGMARRS
jgi:hypothetical protein